MNEHLYNISSGLIAGALLLSMVAAIDVGWRLGNRRSGNATEKAREHINGIQSSILGILALLLGFTFSLALQRFDSRSEAVVDEANAIGTAWLRAQLLPQPLRTEAQVTLRDYVNLRVQASTLDFARHAELQSLLVRAGATQTALWAQARQAMAQAPELRAPAMYVDSVNAMIDSFGRRDAALNRHVPEVVLLLLYGTFIMAGGIVGFASGVAGHRPSMASYILVALIVVLVFVILDLDRPRRGFIEVSPKGLLDLQAQVRTDPAAPR